jgi:serine/threonine protein kinase
VIASGGMATIEYAGQATLAGTLEVVIKRPHARFASEPQFAAMFLDEARLSIRIRHANVVNTLGVLQQPQPALVLEYVPGASLFDLLRLARNAGRPVPPSIASAVITGALHGLHAAHQTHGEDGQPLQIVHRDVTPENILVGADGFARVLDFGIANAIGKIRATPYGEFKGKLAYVAPEQIGRQPKTTHRTDIYSATVVLWEMLAGRSLFARAAQVTTMNAVMNAAVPSLRALRDDVPEALDRIVFRGLARNPADRFESAHAMARALESDVGAAGQSEVMDWVEQIAGSLLRQRCALLRSLRRARQRTAADATHSSERAASEPAPAVVPADQTSCIALQSTLAVDHIPAPAQTRPIAPALTSEHVANAEPMIARARPKRALSQAAGMLAVALLATQAPPQPVLLAEADSPAIATRTDAAAAPTAPRSDDSGPFASQDDAFTVRAPGEAAEPPIDVAFSPAQPRSDAEQPPLLAAEVGTSVQTQPARHQRSRRTPSALSQSRSGGPPVLNPISDFGPRTTISDQRKLLAVHSTVSREWTPSVLDTGWGRR